MKTKRQIIYGNSSASLRRRRKLQLDEVNMGHSSASLRRRRKLQLDEVNMVILRQSPQAQA